MKKTDKVAVGFVDHGTVRGEFAHDLFLLAASRPERFVSVLNIQDSLLARGRNQIMKNFLRTSADWLLLLDADQRFSPDHYDALTEVADDEERPVLSGLYFGIRNLEGLLYPLPLPNIFSKNTNAENSYAHIIHYPPNAVIEIDACGAGVLLVHRKVVEAIKKNAEPGFEDTSWFRDFPIPGGDWLSEDMYFCQQIKKIGLPIYCHTGVVSPHIKHYLVHDAHFENSKVILDSAGFTM